MYAHNLRQRRGHQSGLSSPFMGMVPVIFPEENLDPDLPKALCSSDLYALLQKGNDLLYDEDLFREGQILLHELRGQGPGRSQLEQTHRSFKPRR